MAESPEQIMAARLRREFGYNEFADHEEIDAEDARIMRFLLAALREEGYVVVRGLTEGEDRILRIHLALIGGDSPDSVSLREKLRALSAWDLEERKSDARE